MSSDHLARVVREQARACAELGSPLYASLLERCADDITTGGPTADVLSGHEDGAGPAATALRLLGGVHYLVLEGAAPQLAAWYPSAGGTADPDRAWPALRDVFAHHTQRLADMLEQAPQTNEVGRAAALLGGLLHVVAQRPLPVALHEIGTSAGLNLRADHFWYSSGDDTASWGRDDSPVRLAGAWSGRPPPTDAPLVVVARRGTDIAPLDPTSRQGRLRLLSYVWPDQVERFARLEAAIEVARRVPADVERADAVAAVRRLAPITGRWTVLWHSVMWQYLSRADQTAIEQDLDALGRKATADAPVAHLFLEPTRRTADAEHEFLVVLQTWPGERRILGTAAAHGIPATWESA